MQQVRCSKATMTVVSDSALSPTRRLPRWWRKALVNARRVNLFRWLEIAAAIALALMVGASYLTLATNSEPGELVPSGLAAALLVGTLIPALTVLVLAGRRIAIRRAGGATARLHVNLVFFFSLVAALPTLMVAVFASVLFQSGVDFWFSDNSRGILENANRLARGYYDENQRDLTNNSITMASDLRYNLEGESLSSPEFVEQFYFQVLYRELSQSAILQLAPDGKMQVAAIADPDEDNEREHVPIEALERLIAGEEVVITANPDRIEAVTAIDREAGIYLYIARDSDTQALSQWERAQSVVEAYDVLMRRARVLQLRYNIALFGVSLSLVGLAVWFALRFADRQVQPLTRLVSAAREVGRGNYSLRVGGRHGTDEIGLLNRAFNRMTAQIERQTDALIGANHQLAERRAFMEAVLQSITAGIISIDGEGQVLLMNNSAQELLLGQSEASPIGLALEGIAPQIAALQRSGSSGGIVQYNKNGELLTLAVQVAPSSDGFVITFEDITRQLLDQRQAAWSDVARRIAHEIKNPLTPIQLATERLQRRYRRQIEEDVELFEELTSTIIRQVGALRKMVDEFSSFARLPKPVFRQEDSIDLVRQSLFLQEVAHPEINYVFVAEDEIPAIACDRHQFGQAMTNVLKNAAEAIEARARTTTEDFRGRINVHVSMIGEQLVVVLTDNGVGLPNDSERIMEPYVTTREKGTGIGLAIVKKIVEEHGGDLSFAEAPEGGARATLRFAREPSAVANSEAAE